MGEGGRVRLMWVGVCGEYGWWIGDRLSLRVVRWYGVGCCRRGCPKYNGGGGVVELGSSG